MKLSKQNTESLRSVAINILLPTAIVGGGILAIKKMFFGSNNADGTSTTEAPRISKMKINKSELTITVDDAGLIANNLYGAMRTFGTDEKLIFSSIDLVNTRDDMLLVIRTFGLKRYLVGTWSRFLGNDINLIGWLRAELSESDLNKLKVKFDKWGIPL